MSDDLGATVRPVTAATVSRALGKAHQRSRTGKTRLRAVASRSAGFQVTTDDGHHGWPTVRVEHVAGRDRHTVAAYADARAAVRAYADTLMAAGYIVQMHDDSVTTSGRKIR